MFLVSLELGGAFQNNALPYMRVGPYFSITATTRHSVFVLDTACLSSDTASTVLYTSTFCFFFGHHRPSRVPFYKKNRVDRLRGALGGSGLVASECSPGTADRNAVRLSDGGQLGSAVREVAMLTLSRLA